MEDSNNNLTTTSKKADFKHIMAAIGPGIIMAGACIGPSSLTTASKLGSTYGYQLLWVVILTVLIRALYVKACYTSSILLASPVCLGA